MQTRTITVDYARPRGYDVGYRAENNFTLLALPVPAELKDADSYRVYFESTVGEYLQTELLTPADGYVTVKITSDIVPEPGNMAAQLVAFADGEIVGYAPMITGSAKVSIPDGTERLGHSLVGEIMLNSAARHKHDNKAVLDKFAESDGQPTYDGKAFGGGGDIASLKTDVSTLKKQAHTHSNKAVIDALSAADGKLCYNGSDVGLRGEKGDKGDHGAPGTPGKDGSDGKDGSNGKDGTNGITPTIGTNGNWYLGTTDTGKPSRGEKGDKGADGKDGTDGSPGAAGADGVTPHIGDNGNWFVGNTDTGKPSRGSTGAKGSDGTDGKDGANGKDGTSVTVTSVSESVADGGDNIVTFSDGKRVTIKNGRKGSTGEKGDTGAPGANGQDYILTDTDKSDIADMVDGATIVQAPKYVNSVAEMTDANRPYVLVSTGHIWANANVETEVPVTDTITPTDENPYHDGYRFGSDATTDSMTAGATGYFLTPLIDLTKAAYQGKTIQIHLEGCQYASSGESAQWIQTRVYGLDKTILDARPYTCDVGLSGGSVIYYSNDTIAVTYNGETSATITVSVPPTYKSSHTEVGYLRFCGKGAVANSNITITYTSTTTETQWYDTGATYGNTDARLESKVANLNNEGDAPATYNLLTPAVVEYYDKATYSDSDYSTTNIVRATLPYRADVPQPVTLKWQHNEDAVQTTISVNTSATVLSTGMTQYDATGCDNYPIYNLIPGKTYYYIVTHLLADGAIVTAKSGSFTTNNQPWRLLKIDGIQNVRDLGGWTGLNGQKVKYGKLFRGSALDDGTLRDLLITGAGRREMVSTLGIRAELDLRYDYTSSAISKDTAFLCAAYGSYAQAITTAGYRTAFKTILEWIVARLSESSTKPIYFHCQGGCDRTGTLAFLLLGLLGVSESDLAREYELSSFSAIGAGRVRNSTVYGYSAMVAALKTYSGGTLVEKFVDFATTGCGISTDTINSFKTLMLES